MSYFNPDSEDHAVEQKTTNLFAEPAGETLDCHEANFVRLSLLGRDTRADVVSRDRRRAAKIRLSPGISPHALEAVYDGEWTASRELESAMGALS